MKNNLPKEAPVVTHEIVRHGRNFRILPGLILVALGMIFLLDNYGFTNIDIGRLWPIFLIIPGLYILLWK
jgi:lia operon protein LiaF